MAESHLLSLQEGQKEVKQKKAEPVFLGNLRSWRPGPIPCHPGPGQAALLHPGGKALRGTQALPAAPLPPQSLKQQPGHVIW